MSAIEGALPVEAAAPQQAVVTINRHLVAAYERNGHEMHVHVPSLHVAALYAHRYRTPRFYLSLRTTVSHKLQCLELPQGPGALVYLTEKQALPPQGNEEGVIVYNPAGQHIAFNNAALPGLTQEGLPPIQTVGTVRAIKVAAYPCPKGPGAPYIRPVESLEAAASFAFLDSAFSPLEVDEPLTFRLGQQTRLETILGTFVGAPRLGTHVVLDLDEAAQQTHPLRHNPCGVVFFDTTKGATNDSCNGAPVKDHFRPSVC